MHSERPYRQPYWGTPYPPSRKGRFKARDEKVEQELRSAKLQRFGLSFIFWVLVVSIPLLVLGFYICIVIFIIGFAPLWWGLHILGEVISKHDREIEMRKIGRLE